jgi:hypothetical protein
MTIRGLGIFVPGKLKNLRIALLRNIFLMQVGIKRTNPTGYVISLQILSEFCFWN